MIEPELSDTARSIAEGILTITGNALLDGDSQRFLDCFRVPQELVTELGRRIVDDPTELHQTFQRVRWHYRSSGVTHLDRICVAADYMEHDVILSVHETRTYRGAELTQEPFLAISEINYAEGDWRIRYCNYAVHDSLRFNRALYGPNPIDAARRLRMAQVPD